jgi:hypothetical protein
VESAKVNRQVAEALFDRRVHAVKAKGRKSAEVAASVLEDDRFTAMFKNSDFIVDENAERFQQLNPSGVAGPRSALRRSAGESSDSDAEYLEQFDVVDDEDLARASAGMALESTGNGIDLPDHDDGDSCHSSEESDADKILNRPRRGSRSRMYELKEAAEILGSNGDALAGQRTSKRTVQTVSLGKRIVSEKAGGRRKQAMRIRTRR